MLSLFPVPQKSEMALSSSVEEQQFKENIGSVRCVSDGQVWFRTGSTAASRIGEAVDTSVVDRLVRGIEHLDLVGSTCGGCGEDDIIVSHIAIHWRTDPCSILIIFDAVNTICQMRDRDGGPVSVGSLQESNLNVARIVRSRDKLPTDLTIVPGVGIHIAIWLIVQNELIQGTLVKIQVIGIVAAPGITVLTTVGHNHIKRCPVILVSYPASITTEWLVLRAVVDACAIIANGHLHPASAVQAIAEHTNIIDILGCNWAREHRRVIARIVLYVKGDNVLRVQVSLWNTTATI